MQYEMGQVSTALHEKDQMFTGNIARYLSVGADALKKMQAIMYSSTTMQPARILDLGCGCGRVARHLRAAFPDALMTVADLMPYAVEFCAEQFEGIPHIATPDFSDSFGIKFDLIWSGSLMTHLSEKAALAMLRQVMNSLADGGVAVWTVHGRYTETLQRSGKWPYKLTAEKMLNLVEAFGAEQYGYEDYDHMKGYGISITPLGWLARQMNQHRDFRIVGLIERGWDEHQDIVAIAKRPV